MEGFENAIMSIMKYDYEPDYCVNICIQNGSLSRASSRSYSRRRAATLGLYSIEPNLTLLARAAYRVRPGRPITVVPAH